MEHDFRHSAGEISPHGGMIERAIGQNADEPGDLDVDLVRVVDRRAFQARGERDGRDMEQQIGRTAERGMNDHGVANGGIA